MRALCGVPLCALCARRFVAALCARRCVRPRSCSRLRACLVPFAACRSSRACRSVLCLLGCFVHALCVLCARLVPKVCCCLMCACLCFFAFCVPGGCFVHVLCAMLHRGLGSRARCARRGVFVGVLSLRGPCACHRRHHCGFGARLALLLLGAGARCYTVLLGARPSGFKRARVRNCFVRGPCASGALCFVRRCALCARALRGILFR